MTKFKYMGVENTRVFVPGIDGKVDVKSGETIDVDEKHEDYKESVFLYNDFIVVKMQDKTPKEVKIKKVSKN